MTHLYDYWRSTASYRVRIALGLAKLDWTSIPVNLVEGAQRSEQHLQRNAQGLVPVLAIDDISLTQSLAIIEYLDETRSLGLLPGNAADRARVRALAHAIAMEIHPVCNLRVAKYAVAESEDLISMRSWMQHFIAPGLDALEQMLPDADFCFGDSVTLADICLLPQLYNAQRWEVDLESMPKIRRIADNLQRLEAFAQAHPDKSAQ